MKYRVHLRRESEQVVEVDPADWRKEFRDGGWVVEAANELADPADWFTDGNEVDRIEESDDDGETWQFLPMSIVMQMESDAARVSVDNTGDTTASEEGKP